MSDDKPKVLIDHIHELIQATYPEYEFKISYLTFFSHSKMEFADLCSYFQELGEESEANNGFKYKLAEPIQHAGESISLIRVRKPDVHRPEIGCCDLEYPAAEYDKLRGKALEEGFDIILRKDYEMIELSTFELPVYAYFVKDL